MADEFYNESSMPHSAFAATLSNGVTYDFESWTPRYPSRKINQYRGAGNPKRSAAIRDFDTADSKVQVETQANGVPNNPLQRGLTLTWGDGTVWWLESCTLNQRTGEAWTWDCVWQRQEA